MLKDNARAGAALLLRQQEIDLLPHVVRRATDEQAAIPAYQYGIGGFLLVGPAPSTDRMVRCVR